jgi:hypothetical protein
MRVSPLFTFMLLFTFIWLVLFVFEPKFVKGEDEIIVSKTNCAWYSFVITFAIVFICWITLCTGKMSKLVSV